MADNKIGINSTIELEFMDATCTAVMAGTYTAIGACKEAAPMGREAEAVDTTNLNTADNAPTAIPGGESTTETTFTHAFDLGGADDDQLDLLMDNQCTALWQIVSTDWTETKQRFSAFVVNRRPLGMTRNGLMLEEVTIHRSGAITKVA